MEDADGEDFGVGTVINSNQPIGKEIRLKTNLIQGLEAISLNCAKGQS